MIKIEAQGKMTKEMAKEITSVLMNARTLMKNPEKKLSDVFRFCKVAAIVTVLLTLVFAGLFFRGHADGLSYIAVGMLIAMYILLFGFARTVKKLYGDLLARDRNVTVLIDEEGIDYDDHGLKKLRVPWKGISFIRGFQEALYFFPAESTGFVIAVRIEEKERILEFLQSAGIEVRIVAQGLRTVS